ncbi:glycogen synthase [Escherichia coli]|uniref:glycogen synthase n=1 Tax=Escherichia coli TaxID=562 RepID=UPI0014749575|nr:glycogen synthase [Escherichia coli]NLU90096.1 glycogen synthase [Escherichia coli]
MYAMKKCDVWERRCVGMHVEGQVVDLQAIVGNMDEEHREWFCQRYELYCRQVSSQAEAAH